MIHDGTKYFRFATAEREIHLYPLVCWHRGAPQSDSGFIAGIIERIYEDPNARWIYMGDGGECATKISKGDVYKQTMNPTEQQNDVVRLLTPIREKGLFGIRGNHGNRIYKETGLDFDETLCAKLGIPYLGLDVMWHLILNGGDAKHRTVFDIYTHHGIDSGVTIASKVNKAQQFDRSVDVDAILTAHSHIALDLPPRYIQKLGPSGIVWRPTHEYICGSAYDSRSGYAAEAGYPPILPSHLCITFRADSHHDGRKFQRAEVIRKEDL